MTRVLQPGFYDEVDGMLGSYVQEINVGDFLKPIILQNEKFQCPHFAPISWKTGPPGLKNQVRKLHFTEYKNSKPIFVFSTENRYKILLLVL